MTLITRGRFFAACLAVLAVPISANAHHAMDSALPGNLLQGFVSGLAHPVIGLDHLLFVIAVVGGWLMSFLFGVLQRVAALDGRNSLR